MVRWHRACALIASSLLATGLGVGLHPSPAAASGPVTYYVDDTGGSDSADGTSPATAWRSLAKVDATTFQPGDQILFKDGGSWAGQLHPGGSGSAGALITVGSYGSGAKPLIHADGLAPSAVYLYNQQYWDIGGLEITNHGATAATSPRRGVDIEGEDFQNGTTNDLSQISTLHSIHIHDLYVHDVNGEDKKDGGGSAGIQVSVRISGLDANHIPNPADVHRRTTFDDVVIENNVVDNVTRSGILTWNDWMNRADLGDGIGYGDSTLTPYTPLTHVVIRGNTLTNIGGDGIVPHMTDGALVEHNSLAGFNETSAGYNAGMWTWDGDNTVYQYNDVSGGHSTRDGMAFDFDHASHNVVYQFNYSHDNDGGMLLFCADSRAGGVYDGTFRYNISQNDKYQLFTTCSAGNVYRMRVYSNDFYVGAGMTTSILNTQGGATDVTLMDNIFDNQGTGTYAAKSSWKYSGNLFTGNNVPTRATIPDTTALRADPMFVNPGTGNGITGVDGYQLRQGSPAIGASNVVSNNGGQDFWGNPVSATAKPNHGAYDGPGVVPPPSSPQVINPGFESGTAPWTAWNATVGIGNAHSGSYAAQITGGAGSFEQTITGLSPNTTYTLSGWAKTDAGEARIGVKSYGGTETWASVTTTAYSNGTVTFTTGTASTSAIIYVYKPTSGNTAYFDDIALAKS